MIETDCGKSGGRLVRRSAFAQRTADGLALAASPAFAIMAVLSGVPGAGHAEMHGAADHTSPLSGMVTMYALMSVFHAAPWLRLFRPRTSRVPS
jgi:hypothetical protein